MNRRAVICGLGAVGLIAMAGCRADETVAAYGAAGKTWQLQSIDEAPYQARVTLSFPEPGRISGQAPCNSYNAKQTAPYPWFAIGPIATTRRACPDMQAETTFLAALAAMTLVEVLDDTLILSTETGREMVFTAAF